MMINMSENVEVKHNPIRLFEVVYDVKVDKDPNFLFGTNTMTIQTPATEPHAAELAVAKLRSYLLDSKVDRNVVGKNNKVTTKSSKVTEVRILSVRPIAEARI